VNSLFVLEESFKTPLFLMLFVFCFSFVIIYDENFRRGTRIQLGSFQKIFDMNVGIGERITAEENALGLFETCLGLNPNLLKEEV